MKKRTKYFSLFLGVLMLCMAVMPVSAMAAAPETESENYVEIEVPLVASVSSPIKHSHTMFNAFFNPYQTTATTDMAIFDLRTVNVPTGATVTKVEVTSTKTNVPGMTYYVEIGKGSSVYNLNWAPDILWSSTVTCNYFNNQSVLDYWALQFYATRIITNYPDYGAGATVQTATLKVYFA